MRNPFRMTLSPITRKRLSRFRGMKRAYWSFWMLVLLYAISLCAELICNDRPLFLRFEGKSYFPAFRHYPESTFVPGASGDCNYKELLSRPEFEKDETNYMRWAPVPYGPNEVVPPERIRIPLRATLTLLPRVAAAEVRVDRDFRIVLGGHGAGPLLGVPEGEVLGQRLDDAFRLPKGLRQAAEARFAGEAADSASWECLPQAGREGAPVRLRLSTFSKAASQPRRLIKITLRELSDDKTERLLFSFAGDQRVVKGDADRWLAISGEARKQLDEALGKALTEESVEPFLVDLGEAGSYEARFRRDDVHYPFRPVRGHLLGLDDTGRDVFARLLYGLRTSMTFGLVLVVCSLVFGTIFGAIQGYLGGLADLGGQRFTEIWGALPFLYVMILLGNVYGRGFVLLIFCYALFNWIGMSYYMRAEMLRLRKQPFVEAARCLGLPSHRIVFRHILPNALTPLITLFPFSLVGAIGSLAALDYLGFGLPPPTPSWGELLGQAQDYRWAWWLILYPALALFVVMLLGVFVGEGVRAAFDPRRHSRLQ